MVELSINTIIYRCFDLLGDGIWCLEIKPEDRAAVEVFFESSDQFSAISGLLYIDLEIIGPTKQKWWNLLTANYFFREYATQVSIQQQLTNQIMENIGHSNAVWFHKFLI